MDLLRMLPLVCSELDPREFGVSPKRAGLTYHELYIQGLLPKQMLAALLEDQVLGLPPRHRVLADGLHCSVEAKGKSVTYGNPSSRSDAVS